MLLKQFIKKFLSLDKSKLPLKSIVLVVLFEEKLKPVITDVLKLKEYNPKFDTVESINKVLDELKMHYPIVEECRPYVIILADYINKNDDVTELN